MESEPTRVPVAEELEAFIGSREQLIADLRDEEGYSQADAEAIVDGEIEALRELQYLEGQLQDLEGLL